MKTHAILGAIVLPLIGACGSSSEATSSVTRTSAAASPRGATTSAAQATPPAASGSAPAPSASAAPSGSAAGGASLKGACHNVPSGFCNEFTGSGFTEEQVKTACDLQKVKPLGGPCPSADRVGVCLVYASQPTESRYHYYKSFPGGAAAAEKQCRELLKGEWSAP